MTLNFIETLTTSIYNPKNTPNTKMHFKLWNLFKKWKSIFFKTKKFK